MTISTSKSIVILRNVPLKSLIVSGGTQSEEDASLSIEIYFQLKPMVSLIVNYMTLFFGSLTNSTSAQMEPGVYKLSVDELSMMLSHRKVGVASEDDVISVLVHWFNHNL
jgi:hypothetical protein